MARQARFILAGFAHLVRQRGHNAGAVAHDAVDQQRWLEVLRDVAATHKVVLHGWSLQATEYRLLLRPPSAQALSRMIQDLGRRYVAAFNARHHRQGTLWAGRFQCAAVEGGELELAALAFVEQVEPLSPAASSGAHHLGDMHDATLVDPPAYWALGNTPFDRHMAWRQRLEAGLDATSAARVLGALSTGRPLAAAQTLTALQPLTAMPLKPRPRGRPRRASPPRGRQPPGS